ncbi:MAG TPA: DUF1549 and DUF1553 domain-containing protein [Verrucomicrobiae bacterium]
MERKRIIAGLVAGSMLAMGGLFAAEIKPLGKGKSIDMEQGRKHWSYQPVQNPAPASVKNKRWLQTELDSFILAKLEKEGLKPSLPAEKRVLIRRAYFDLVGLPPTYEEVEAFVADKSPKAFEQLVDKLLSRPEYGQRWGRHWLDVARYADTIEQSVDGERRIPFAHTYRDYVIDAFNADKPFDQFIREQIAADRLPEKNKADLRALGFLTVGRQFRSNEDGPNLVIDDRIDTITRGFLGLTVSCARCHDHKFDPVPTADYYSLYGILGSVQEPMDLPELKRTGDAAALEKYEKERTRILKEYDAHVDTCMARANQHFRDLASEYLQYQVRISPNHRTTEGYVPMDTPKGLMHYQAWTRWQALLRQTAENKEPFFKLWHQLMILPREGFAEKAQEVLSEMGRHPRDYHVSVVAAFQGRKPQTMLQVAEMYGGIVQAAVKADTPEARYVTNIIFGAQSPVPPRDRQEMIKDIHRFLTEKELVNRGDGERGDGLRTQLAVLEATAPVERPMAVKATMQPLDPHILIRGEMKNVGTQVPRRFLQVLAKVDGRTYADDGRLQLAEAIASKENPLVARVIVNRVWQQHFGQGLVPTTDDFGVMGQEPSHPQLLDHLASWFMEHGWSVKALHRYILSSATWQQSSAGNERALLKDPGNKLLWRMSPRRLEFEPLRDSLLQVAGKLDTSIGGRGAALDEKNVRRAVYGHTDRFRIPALLRNFDVANPDTSIARRSETTVPLQALYLMNSGFARQQAEAVLKRPEMVKAASAEEKVKTAFRLVYSRQPTREELKLAQEYAGPIATDEAGNKRWVNLVQGLLIANEFVFVD